MAIEVISENSHQGMQVLAWDNGVSSLKRLDGKVTIITSGARVIGEVTVRIFVRHDAKVVIADIEDAKGQALANSLGPVVVFIHCDVTSEEDIATAINWTLSCHDHLDIFFNNAGVLGNQSKCKSILDLVDGWITSSRNCVGL